MTDLYGWKVFYSAEDKAWIAVAPEIPGCSAFGKTPEKALEELDMAIALWLETAKSKKWRVPKPLANRKVGGKILLRLPRERDLDSLVPVGQKSRVINDALRRALLRIRREKATKQLLSLRAKSPKVS